MFNFDQAQIFEFLIRIPIVLISLSVHETAHAYAAYKLGDPTARNLGRLSLNPLKHFDPIGAICMVLFRIGWAKPVPIRSRNFKNPRVGMAVSALAGPLSNLIMAFIAYVVCLYIQYFGIVNQTFFWDFFNDPFIFEESGKIAYVLCLFFFNFFILNTSLAVFNLLPIPPLDGSRILFVFLPDKVYFGVMKYEQIIYLALLAGLWTGILDGPIDAVFGLFIDAFNAIVQFLPFL